MTEHEGPQDPNPATEQAGDQLVITVHDPGAQLGPEATVPEHCVAVELSFDDSGVMFLDTPLVILQRLSMIRERVLDAARDAQLPLGDYAE